MRKASIISNHGSTIKARRTFDVVNNPSELLTTQRDNKHTSSSYTMNQNKSTETEHARLEAAKLRVPCSDRMAAENEVLKKTFSLLYNKIAIHGLFSKK